MLDTDLSFINAGQIVAGDLNAMMSFLQLLMDVVLLIAQKQADEEEEEEETPAKPKEDQDETDT